MKKTIMLTFLMLFCSVVADTLVHSSAQGTNTISAYSSAEFLRDINNKKKIADSISLVQMVFDILEKINVTEKVETQILYRHVKGTVYHAERSQTDSTPLLTADMSLIDTAKVNDLRWVALSRDLIKRRFTDPHGKRHIWSGKIKLGDTIWIDYDAKNIWKITHAKFKSKNNKYDSIINVRNDLKYLKLKQKYEQIKGYWIVHDVMGTEYTLRNRKGDYILDKNGKKQVIEIKNAIDFLQHPELGMMDVWDRNIVIAKRKVSYITSTQILMASK